MGIVFEALGKHHDRAEFSSGQPALDDWFRKRASQDEKRNLAHTFVAMDDELGIVGFYSISTLSVAFDVIPPEISRKLPRYDEIPAALIGRLARHEQVRGRGLGEMLLTDALRRILDASKTLQLFVIIVDAKDDKAAEFYTSYGFQRFPHRPNRLFIQKSVVMSALERSLD
nr:GNAT family N-acetyltransferase [Brucella anthropi]